MEVLGIEPQTSTKEANAPTAKPSLQPPEISFLIKVVHDSLSNARLPHYAMLNNSWDNRSCFSTCSRRYYSHLKQVK